MRRTKASAHSKLLNAQAAGTSTKAAMVNRSPSASRKFNAWVLEPQNVY